jgi:hypothetical protein
MQRTDEAATVSVDTTRGCWTGRNCPFFPNCLISINKGDNSVTECLTSAGQSGAFGIKSGSLAGRIVFFKIKSTCLAGQSAPFKIESITLLGQTRTFKIESIILPSQGAAGRIVFAILLQPGDAGRSAGTAFPNRTGCGRMRSGIRGEASARFNFSPPRPTGPPRS